MSSLNLTSHALVNVSVNYIASCTYNRTADIETVAVPNGQSNAVSNWFVSRTFCRRPSIEMAAHRNVYARDSPAYVYPRTVSRNAHRQAVFEVCRQPRGDRLALNAYSASTEP